MNVEIIQKLTFQFLYIFNHFDTITRTYLNGIRKIEIKSFFNEYDLLCEQKRSANAGVSDFRLIRAASSEESVAGAFLPQAKQSNYMAK